MSGAYVGCTVCAVLSFPSFDLVFLFHLLGQVALTLVTFFALSVLSLLFLFFFSFLPFCLDLFGLGVFVPFRRLLFFVLCSDLLSSFPRDFLLPSRSGVLHRSWVLFFFFEVFLSAFEISFSSRPFLFFWRGGLAWTFCLRSCVGFCGLFSWLWEDLCFCLCLGR